MRAATGPYFLESRFSFLLLVLIGFSTPTFAQPVARRHLAIVLDDSGSMSDSDPGNLGPLVINLSGHILSLGPAKDRLSLVCWSATKAAIIESLSEVKVDSFCESGGHNQVVAVEAGVKALQDNKSSYPRRMLVQITDSTDSEAVTTANRRAMAKGDNARILHIYNANSIPDRYPPVSRVKIYPVPVDRCKSPLAERFVDVFAEFLETKSLHINPKKGGFDLNFHPFATEAFVVAIRNGLPKLSIVAPKASSTPAVVVQGPFAGASPCSAAYALQTIKNPGQKRWFFSVDKDAGVFALQKLGLELKIDPLPSFVSEGVDLIIRAYLVDRRGRTPKVLSMPSYLKKVKIKLDPSSSKWGPSQIFTYDGRSTFEAKIDAQRVVPGVFKAIVKATDDGVLDQTRVVETTIKETIFELALSGPGSVIATESFAVSARVTRKGRPVKTSSLPKYIEVETQGPTLQGRIRLRDDGRAPDRRAGDGEFGGRLQFDKLGNYELRARFKKGGKTFRASARVIVNGAFDLEFPPVNFGKLQAGATATTSWAASGRVVGPHTIKLSCSLPEDKFELAVVENGHQAPLRHYRWSLDTGVTPALSFLLSARTCVSPRYFEEAVMSGTDAEGDIVFKVALKALFKPNTWWFCWWQWVVGTVIGILLIFTILGWILPARFESTIGILSVPTLELLDEEFPSGPLRAHSAIGWYRNARVYINGGGQITKRRNGAVVRIIAGTQPLVENLGGELSIQDISGETGWRRLGGDDADLAKKKPKTTELLRFNEVYKYGHSDFFFRVTRIL